uniref:BAR domain-containing protein n=1 Tax=Xiphophorus couchianus TaxID=32473 RepID=A0A3B5L0K9_9TELE
MVQVEQRVEPAKKAAQVLHKKLQACMQSPVGLEAERRMVKKLPLMLLSISMAESLKDFDAQSSIRRVLEMCCFMEKRLATMLADFELTVEKEVLEPLNKLSEVRNLTALERTRRAPAGRGRVLCRPLWFEHAALMDSSLPTHLCLISCSFWNCRRIITRNPTSSWTETSASSKRTTARKVSAAAAHHHFLPRRKQAFNLI